MQTICLRLPTTIRELAAAVGEEPAALLLVLRRMGVEKATRNAFVDEHIARQLGLKFCCYVEEKQS